MIRTALTAAHSSRPALATASALSLAPAANAQDLVAKDPILPKRKLGKTGVEITILEQGAVRSNERILRTAYANGIRVFDTAKVYGTEPKFQTSGLTPSPRFARRSSSSPRICRRCRAKC